MQNDLQSTCSQLSDQSLSTATSSIRSYIIQGEVLVLLLNSSVSYIFQSMYSRADQPRVRHSRLAETEVFLEKKLRVLVYKKKRDTNCKTQEEHPIHLSPCHIVFVE